MKHAQTYIFQDKIFLGHMSEKEAIAQVAAD